MKKMKSLISLGLIMVMTLSLLAGCGQKSETAAGSTDSQATEAAEVINKEDIVVALSSDIVSLDPQGHNDARSEKVSFLLYNRLFKLNTDFEAVPDLAESWEQPSDKEWVIKIKEGVMFTDGTEMTAEDVKYSLNRSKESATVKHVLSEVESIEVVDTYTVKITTKVPFAPFLFTLAHAGASIMPKAYVESGDNFAAPVGSAQYKFVEWVSGDKIVLERNDDYYDKENMGASKTITFKVIPEGTSRTIALETGEVDVVANLETIDVSKVTDNAKLSLYEAPSTRMDYLGMNVEKAPFDNKLVRQAMNYAVDKEAIVEIAINGAGVPATSITAPALLGHKDLDYGYNPEKAKEILKQAGKENLEVTIWASGDLRKRIAEVVQANLMEIGVQAEIEMFEWGAYLEATNSGKQQMFVLAWTSNPDPDSCLTPLFAESSIGSQNRARYANERVEELLEAGRVELDLEKREAIYNELHEIVMEDAPWVPLYVQNFVVGANAQIKGVEMSPQGLWNLHKLSY